MGVKMSEDNPLVWATIKELLEAQAADSAVVNDDEESAGISRGAQLLGSESEERGEVIEGNEATLGNGGEGSLGDLLLSDGIGKPEGQRSAERDNAGRIDIEEVSAGPVKIERLRLELACLRWTTAIKQDQIRRFQNQGGRT
jgi:hypothetical protein